MSTSTNGTILKRKAVEEQDIDNQVEEDGPSLSAPTGKKKKARASQRKRRKRVKAADAAGETTAGAATVSSDGHFSLGHAEELVTDAELPEINEADYIWEEHHIPPYLTKYWYQRYSLFSMFNEGVMLDEEGWYSITPEKIATHIAQRCSRDTIVDAFCGVGGNTIQFAKVCKKVIAVDIDPIKIRCAQHNARVYGVADKIQFVLGDFMKLAPKLKADAVFLSPPWGGPSYLKAKVFDMHSMMMMDGGELFDTARSISNNICYYMPRNIDHNQLIQVAPPGHLCEIEEVFLNDRLKCCIAYYRELAKGQADGTVVTPAVSTPGPRVNYTELYTPATSHTPKSSIPQSHANSITIRHANPTKPFMLTYPKSDNITFHQLNAPNQNPTLTIETLNKYESPNYNV
ncbi:Trimethylguanosine synthase [Rhizophlyctis rosea]|nr:Trimethylguanosine synthase [Rhizophlyctis rosea]